MNKFLKTGLAFLIILGLWELLFRASFLNLAFISAPSKILKIFFVTSFWQMLAQDLAYTLARLAIGSLIGFVLAYLLIFITVLLPSLFGFFSQVNNLVKYIPIPVLIPIAILMFGLNDFTKIFTIAFTVLIIYFNYLISILNKEEKTFADLQKSWNTTKINRFFKFIVPISIFLSYRVITSALIWAIGIEIIVELIVGGKYGLGIRISEFQQIFQTDALYAYILVIILLGVLLERSLIYSFCRLQLDKLKIICSSFLIVVVIFSFGFLGQTLASNLNFENTKYVTSYKALINLPLFVYLEKYNDLKLVYNETASGIPAINSLQAGKSVVAGFSDLPSALAGILKNSDLKIVAQNEERKDNATLFLITKKADVSEKDFSSLNGSNLGYYPDSRVILSGLEFSINLKKANSGSMEINSSGDPQSLVQAFITGQMDSVLHIEPYISRLEKASGISRINPKNSLIEGISFETLPLTGLVIDTKKFSDKQLVSFKENIQKSIQFIENHLNTNNRADSELAKIMQKYDLDPESSIPSFNYNKDTMSKNLIILVNLLRLISPEVTKDLKNENLPGFYL